MKTPLVILLLFTASLIDSMATPLGGAITFQGRLNDAGQAANGEYDFRFILYDAAIGGNQTGSILTNENVWVTNGVFTTALDFGTNIFTGQALWIDLAVRPGISGGDFAALSPRQALFAVPYALYALTPAGPPGPAGAQGLTGVQGPQGVAGSVGPAGPPGPLGPKGDPGDQGPASPAGLQGPPGSADAWGRAGNAGTSSGNNFIGTTDYQPLDVRVNNTRALRLLPDNTSASAPNVIAGSSVNITGPGVVGAVIGGGGSADYEGSGPALNVVASSYGTVSGGAGNVVAGTTGSTISGGYNNRSTGRHNFVGGGLFNQATNIASTIAGGRNNRAYGTYSTVGGGTNGVASGDFSTVAGGWDNTASGGWTTVSGGAINRAENAYATIAGGQFNRASGGASTVGGGAFGHAVGDFSTVGGGQNNTASDFGSIVAGGYGNDANGVYSVVSGGYGNDANGNYSTVAGGRENDSAGVYSVVSGGRVNAASGIYSTVAGGWGNNASGGYSTIGGGTNVFASGNYSTVGGGVNNTSSGAYAVVGGGSQNTNSGTAALIAGGAGNECSGNFATIGGGLQNQCTGWTATVPGGANNLATGSGSFAAGTRATAAHSGTFVWADGLSESFTSTAPSQFLIHAQGGVGIGHNAPDAPLHVVGGADASLTGGGTLVLGAVAGANMAMDNNEIVARNNGVASTLFLNPAGGNVSIGTASSTARLRVVNATCNGEVWSNSSDRNLKAGFESVDTHAVLSKVAALPISRWHYTNAPAAQHIGPMAQDFQAAFGLGSGDKSIATVDADGVALAAIQELHALTKSQAVEIGELKKELVSLRGIIDTIRGERRADVTRDNR